MIFILGYFILELLFSIKFGMSIGFGWSVVWVVGTSILGGVLLKLSPYAIADSFNKIAFERFDIVSAQNAALSYVLGAILLIIPGILSDFLGIALLLYTLYLRLFAKMPQRNENIYQKKGDDDVIDVEIIESSSCDDSSSKRGV